MAATLLITVQGQWTFVWLLANKIRAVDGGSDVYPRFTQPATNGCTWAHLSRWSQVAEEERDNKTSRQLQKTRVIFVHFKRMTAFKQNTWTKKKTLEILEQLQERLETVRLERRAINAPLSSTDPPPNSVSDWGQDIYRVRIIHLKCRAI